jgi:hypothetical protein
MQKRTSYAKKNIICKKEHHHPSPGVAYAEQANAGDKRRHVPKLEEPRGKPAYIQIESPVAIAAHDYS